MQGRIFQMRTGTNRSHEPILGGATLCGADLPHALKQSQGSTECRPTEITEERSLSMSVPIRMQPWNVVNRIPTLRVRSRCISELLAELHRAIGPRLVSSRSDPDSISTVTVRWKGFRTPG